MPGLVKSVNVKIGESVSEGQEVLVIGESTKVQVLVHDQSHFTYFSGFTFVPQRQ